MKERFALCSTQFDTLPDGWINNGFDVRNGLHSPEVGGTGVTAYWDIYSVTDNHSIRTIIRMNDTASVFALFKKYTVHGGIGVVDCKNKALSLYKPWNGQELPEKAVSVPITLPLLEGREYLVTLKKRSSLHKLSVEDTVTGQRDTVCYQNSNHPYDGYAGKQWGAPGVMFLSGSITVTQFDYTYDAPRCCRALIIGDSITEGYGMDNCLANYDQRWSALIRAALGGSCAICGRGAGDSTDMLQRLAFELTHFEPQYIVVMIGTNDTDFAVWRENIETAAKMIQAAKAVPVFCVPSMGVNRDLVPKMGEYLRKSQYLVASFDYATSLDNQGIHQDASLFNDDVHPNSAGHLRMFHRFVEDVAEIFLQRLTSSLKR